MVKIIIVESLFNEIKKKFNLTEANEILDLLESLEISPKKGKEISVVGNIVIKKLRLYSEDLAKKGFDHI